MWPKTKPMKNFALALPLVVMLPASMFSQSRWNNYFIAHFWTPEETPIELVDSLAIANDWHRTYHAPMIGHTESIYDFPYQEEDIYSVIEPLVVTDSVVNTARLISLGDGNGRVNTPVLEAVVYEPGFSPNLSWDYFQYLAEECVDADYYQVKVPTTTAVLEAIEIIKSRPSFSSENWYFNVDGYAVATASCMEYGFSVTPNDCNSTDSREAATQATEYVAGWIQNISGQPWFPFVLNMNSQTSNWDWPGCTNNGDSFYELGQMSPSTGCLPQEEVDAEYWSCDTVYVACPDLDNNNLIGIGDLVDILSVYGNPYNCSEQD